MSTSPSPRKEQNRPSMKQILHSRSLENTSLAPLLLVSAKLLFCPRPIEVDEPDLNVRVPSHVVVERAVHIGSVTLVSVTVTVTAR